MEARKCVPRDSLKHAPAGSAMGSGEGTCFEDASTDLAYDDTFQKPRKPEVGEEHDGGEEEEQVGMDDRSHDSEEEGRLKGSNKKKGHKGDM